MWDEVKGYVGAFVILPLLAGALWMGGYRLVTGEWYQPVRSDCHIEWDGVSNPTVCD